MSESTRYGMTTADWARVRENVYKAMLETLESRFESSELQKYAQKLRQMRADFQDEHDGSSTLLLDEGSPFGSDLSAEPTIARELAVMSVDMRGSSRLTELDPKSAICLVRGLLTGVVAVAQSSYIRGRVVGFRGDGLLLGFHGSERSVVHKNHVRALHAALSCLHLVKVVMPDIIVELHRSGTLLLSVRDFFRPEVGLGLSFGNALVAVVGGSGPLGAREPSLYGPIVNDSWKAANMTQNRNAIVCTEQFSAKFPSVPATQAAYLTTEVEDGFMLIEEAKA